MNEIITYDVFIDEDDELGVDKISLVRKPAIMENFIYMNEELSDDYKQISLSEDERMIITGPALIPDQEIIRKDDKDSEPYYIKYSAEQIEKIVQKFFKSKDQFSVNKDHKTDANDVYIYESWIVGDNDKSKDFGMNFPKGTWMVSMKIDNEEIWQGIKSGKYKGLSIEGLFRFKRSSKLVKQKKWKRQVDSSNIDRVMFEDETGDLVVKFNDGETYTYSGVNFVEFVSVINGLASCKTEGSNKWGEWYVGKTPSVGAAVWQYLIDAGKAYRKGGSLQEEVELLEVEKINLEEDKKNKNINMVSTILKDGSTLYTDAETIDVGSEVYFMNGEEKVKPTAGEYEAEDGSIIVIGEDSIVSEIKVVEVEAEETAGEEKVDEKPTEDVKANEMEAIVAMLADISAKLDLLMGEKMSSVEQSMVELSEKVEKMSVEKEMKSVETIDDKKKIAQSESIGKKTPLDYNLITRLNRKF